MDFTKLKLVIWDLDDTFWNGTISEERINPIPANIELVKRLVGRGIMCSIASKNDYNQVKQKLIELDAWDYFVFPSISWDAKGIRIKSIINEMNLRAQNVLFIDDNKTNLNEAIFNNAELNVAGPEIIKELINSVDLLGKNDSNLSRLAQYKILEKRTHALHTSKNEDKFLKKSKICISFHSDCYIEIDRLFEMIDRTHQLNYTKISLTKPQLVDLISSKNYECKYIKCKDRFGEYGIIGFYCLDKTKNELIHFLFSCRTLGLHIESYVYQLIGKPKLNIIPPVAANLISQKIDYVRVVSDASSNNSIVNTEHDVLFRGPCDIDAIAYYLKKDNIFFESSVKSDHGGFIYSLGHSQILRDLRAENISNSKFNEKKAYLTNIYKKEYKLIVISLFSESLYGLYKEKNNNNYIVYGESTKDATINNGELYLNKNANIFFDDLTENDYAEFSKNFVYIGPTPYEQFEDNLRCFVESINKNTKICFLLPPSKMAIKNESNGSLQKAIESGYLLNLNEITKRICAQTNNCAFIDTTKIALQTKNGKKVYAFTSNNHLSRLAYLKIAKRLHKMYKKYILLSSHIHCTHKIVNFLKRIAKHVLRKVKSNIDEKKEKKGN